MNIFIFFVRYQVRIAK